VVFTFITIGVDLIEGSPQLKTIEHVGFVVWTKEEIERLTRVQ
jgi:hypothetical protein